MKRIRKGEKMPRSPVGAKKKIKEGDLVVIAWADACTHGGWRDKADYKKYSFMPCASVGWVVTNTSTHVTVVQTVAEDQMTDSITIPKGWIKDMRRLR